MCVERARLIGQPIAGSVNLRGVFIVCQIWRNVKRAPSAFLVAQHGVSLSFLACFHAPLTPLHPCKTVHFGAEFEEKRKGKMKIYEG